MHCIEAGMDNRNPAGPASFACRLTRSETQPTQASKTQWLQHCCCISGYNVVHAALLMSKAFPSLDKRLQCARHLMQLHFPIYSLSACCVSSLSMSSVEQGPVQKQTILTQGFLCPLAQDSRANCVHVTWLKAFKLKQLQHLKCSMSTWHCNVKVRPCRLFLNSHSLSLIFWLPDTRPNLGLKDALICRVWQHRL